MESKMAFRTKYYYHFPNNTFLNLLSISDFNATLNMFFFSGILMKKQQELHCIVGAHIVCLVNSHFTVVCSF